VIPALIRKFHEAKIHNNSTVTIWGTGKPKREFMYSEDMADACIYLMGLPEEKFQSLLGSDESKTGKFDPPLVNVGVGEDITIRELAVLISEVVAFRGDLVFDTSKPDGTPRKLMDTALLNSMGWRARTPLAAGLAIAYAEFVSKVELSG
jgi:GDP-L-fucose synthase